MAKTVNDIPSRDSQDGATQLALLHAYLKDRDSANYKFPDTLLIPLLVEKDKVSVWRDLTGYGTTSVAWSYDPLKLNTPVNRIRAVTGDTVEATLKYTDHDLLRLLEVIPLRYVVSIIKAKEAAGKTFPSDPNDPLHILRKYLEDETGVKYTDVQLIDMLIASGMNPFGVITDAMDKAIGSSSSSTVTKTGTNLASIDGITFDSPLKEVKQSKYGRDFVAEQAMRSVYARDPVYGMYVDGVNIAATDWETRWYAL